MNTSSSGLFNIIFNALSPYMYDILSLAFILSLFSASFKIVRSRSGGMNQGMNGNPYQNIVNAMIGFGLGKGIPIILKITDNICTEVLRKLS